MRVGIDAKNLSAELTGIGRYIVEMTKHLHALGCDIRLYLPQPPRHEFFNADRIEIIDDRLYGIFGRAVWSQIVLPNKANRDRIDVFWGPAHRIPPFLRHCVRVITIHDLVWLKLPGTMATTTWLGERLLMGSSLKRADRVVTLSNATAKDVMEFYPALKAPVRVIHPGVTDFPSLASLDALTARGIDRQYMLFVGTQEPRKNLDRLIGAYLSLPSHIRQKCHLVIAGSHGWGKPSIVPSGVAEIRMLGRVGDAELGALYANCRFLVMPSLLEGFGFPILEAQRFGKPVVTSRTSSMPEVAGEGALFVDPYSEADIARSLLILIEENDVYSWLASAAQRNAVRFDWGKAASDMKELIESAVGGRA